LIGASESTRGEGRSDRPVIDTDEGKEKEDRSKWRLEDRVLKQGPVKESG